MHRNTLRHTLLAVLGATASSLALAHVGTDGAPHVHDGSALRSLMDGALHPLTGLDHLAAMLSVGVWSAIPAACMSGRIRRQDQPPDQAP